MTAKLPETTSKMEGPLVKQFSVFLPNKVGAMLDVVKLLNTAKHTCRRLERVRINRFGHCSDHRQ